MRQNRVFFLGAFIFLLAIGEGIRAEQPDHPSDETTLPPTWLNAWKNPPLVDRPLQIIHGIDFRRQLGEGVQQILQQNESSRVQKLMTYYRNCGLGGVVCNVAFQKYLQSEENWKTLIAGVEALEKLGMVVWLYDEHGYPSGAAGGLVLKENPTFEALELAFDPAQKNPFIIRPAFEFTHASNNFHACQRYVNLLDDQAIRTFIAKTHQAYFQRLKPYFGRTVQAMFTDEPSLIAVNLGQIPEVARVKVPVVDPIDPAVRPLPAVPWCRDLPQRYQERYGQDLLPQRKSLFTGQTAEDRKVRRQFWSLVADLVADRYFGALRNWCQKHGISSSGHTLWEESLLHHVPLEGNAIKVLSLMDIPGLDLLTSNPEAVLHSGWMTAGLPCSAAVLQGRRRVMTEVSDFSQTLNGGPPAGLAEMQATAAWQAAWGVTDFTLYYNMAARTTEQYQAYCNYVGRLNAILKPARLDSRVLLYYPIYDLWHEYLPVAEPLRQNSQTPLAQKIVRSFMHLGQTLQHKQIPFVMIDHENLAKAVAGPKGKLTIGMHSFEAILLPEGVELEPMAAAVVNEFQKQGGRVLGGSGDSPPEAVPTWMENLQRDCRIAPVSSAIALGRFKRDERSILLVVNVGKELYDGVMTTESKGTWQILDPATGTISSATKLEDNRFRFRLAPRQALFLVQKKS